ncbi:MAG: cadherin domain-containing protein [Chloroflexi bacterium]|nr:cadherin domain-containing protein [Chloroflexota bacterium]
MAILLALTCSLLLASSIPAGAQQEAAIEYAENDTGTVAVFTATDPENAGDITWSLLEADTDDVTAGPDFGDLAIDASTGVLTFAEVPDYEMAVDANENNVYEVTVVATDADGIATYEAVTVNVTNVDEAGSVTLDKVAPYPGIVLTATQADPDGSITSAAWQWSKSRSRSGSFTDIEDAEAATYSPTSRDEDCYLRATVTYNDGEGEGKSAIATSMHTVQSPNVPNADPVFPDENDDSGDTADRAVEENTAAGEDVGLPVAADDADNNILTYTLDDTAAAFFDIDAATGQIQTKVDLDTEETTSYTATVTAADPAGLNDAITVTITVTNVNEPPTITGDVDDYTETTEATANTDPVVTFTVADPETAGTNVLDLTGADASLFSLTQGGELSFDAPPNFESPADADKDNSYELTIGARDADGNRGTRDITVKVTNEDEPGTVTLSAVQPRVGVAVTASLTDIDGPVSGVTWQWSAAGTAIVDATSDTYTPIADEVADTLTATATYTDPQGSGKMTSGDSTNPVAADTRNKAPVFDDQDMETDGTQNTEATRTIAENSVATTVLNGGGAVTATDPNAGSPLNDLVSYRLGGPDASSFDIGLTTGVITVGTGTKLDFETKDTYMVTVIATDSYGESSSIAVTINVTGENEGPEIMRGGLAISGLSRTDYAENGTANVETFSVAGPYSANAAWSLSGDDMDAFSLSSNGVLTFNASPDFEAPADADGDSVYTVTVKADDGTYSNTRAVTVTVTNEPEGGTLTVPSSAPKVGTPVMAELDDPDVVTPDSETWLWENKSQDGTFSVIAGATMASYTPVTTDQGKALRVTVTYTDPHGSDNELSKETGAVTAADPLLAEYDPNGDGTIELDDMRRAVGDFFGPSPTLTKDDMRRLVGIYFSS